MGVDNSFTKSLLHFDNNITDESGKTWANAASTPFTATAKFGSHAIDFTAGSDYIDTADSDDWNVGSGDFTVDFWMYPTTNNISGWICGQLKSDGASSSGAWSVRFNGTTNKLNVTIVSGSTQYTAESASAYSTNSWQHVAGVRDGNTLRLFIAGTEQATANVTGITANDSANKMAIGRAGEYNGLYARYLYLDEFRFSKGIARWTTDFTPPTEAYKSRPLSSSQAIIF